MPSKPEIAVIRSALLLSRIVIQQDRKVLLRSYCDASGRIDVDARRFLEQYVQALAKIDAALQAVGA